MTNTEKNKKTDKPKKKTTTSYTNRYISVEKHGENGRLFEPHDYNNGYNGSSSRNNH